MGWLIGYSVSDDEFGGAFRGAFIGSKRLSYAHF